MMTLATGSLLGCCVNRGMALKCFKLIHVDRKLFLHAARAAAERKVAVGADVRIEAEFLRNSRTIRGHDGIVPVQLKHVPRSLFRG